MAAAAAGRSEVARAGIAVVSGFLLASLVYASFSRDFDPPLIAAVSDAVEVEEQVQVGGAQVPVPRLDSR